jgi:acetylornithine deacetylase/succinyl-diaminopimelate desuccinylase-like protein
LDTAKVAALVHDEWRAQILPTLCEYIAIPNISPLFDPQWQQKGHTAKAVDLLVAWALKHGVAGQTVEVVQLPGRTPLIFIEVPAANGGNAARTVLMYGHLDKQPPLEPSSWKAGLGPYTPVEIDGKLYGRGGADDGYSIFSAVTAIRACQLQGVPIPRCVVLIEASEESGSPDLPTYMQALKERLGPVSLVVCLDSGSGDYNRFWMTASLRGVMMGSLKVSVLREGVHSGASSGVVPSSFRIMRQLISRLEDEQTGRVLIPECFAQIPEESMRQTVEAAKVLGTTVTSEYPFLEGVQAMGNDGTELLLNRGWRPTVSYVGIGGMPPLASAGNVLRTHTELVLSIRLPPTCDVSAACAAIKRTLESNPPYNAKVEFSVHKSGTGWLAPFLAPWLCDALTQGAKQVFSGNDFQWLSEGGSIPFMAMLHKQYPSSDFVITGVLGPKSNAHGPNEFLHIAQSERVTVMVAHILAQKAKNPSAAAQ